MTRKLLLSVLLVISLVSCKEEFYPVIDRQPGALVVQGMITNLKESYKVKLTMASPYDSAINNSGILGASVSIIDDFGNTYPMHEDHYLKNYFSDTTEFIGIPGRSYTIHIEMPGGDIYESPAQRLLQPASINSIHGITTDKESWYIDRLGNIVTKLVYGAQTFMDFRYNSDSIVQFRFDNTLMKCYSYMYLLTPEMIAYGVPFPPPKDCPGLVCPYLMYNWRKYNLNTNINLTTPTLNVATNEIMNSSVCFFPFDTSFYPIVYQKDSCATDHYGIKQCATIRRPEGPEGKILGTRLYALNKTASIYYQELNKQLSSEGKLFDPIAVQLQGNIKCINNPDKIALGYFEVSSCTTRSYWLRFNYLSGYIEYIPIKDIFGLNETGSSKVMQDFWH